MTRSPRPPRSVTIHVGLPRPRLRPPPLDRHRRLGRPPRRRQRHRRRRRPRLPHRLHAARQRVQGRPGAARGERPEPGRLRRRRSWSRPSRASTTPRSRRRSRTLFDFAAEQDGVTVTSPYDNPQQISAGRHDRLRPARRRRPRASRRSSTSARRSRTSATSNTAVAGPDRSSTAATCSASSSCPRASSSASSPPSSS